MNLPDYLPPTAREIAEIIQLEGLMQLVKHKGGTVIRIPGSGSLKKILTADQYQKFTHHFKGEKLFIPRLQAKANQLAKQETKRLNNQGMTKTAIALKQNITERTVYNRLADNNKQQKELF